MSERALLVLAVSNAAFAFLVGLAYRSEIQGWASFGYRALSSLVSSELVLAPYALILVYILVSLHSLKDDVAQATARPIRRKRVRPQPVYDANDRLIGYFRGGDRRSDVPSENTRPVTANPVLDGAALAPKSPESRTSTVSPPPPIVFQPPQVHVYCSLQASEWNGWPDGHLQCQLRRQELKEVGNLALFWVCEPIAGRRPGSPDADLALRTR
ncbi:hypothetical protein MIND_00907500 [Mycena indigotica]|uniref:Uncharacterized protein n=1 Tax=Mycena indigotica TaxID=2126181 RepID=A0A8H6SD60_9AGAR|nr:uncharacterized protein MIND_00907500 [Mycena indigotica]KAF7296768.1 hypothetical protein MIND_00907500 [Mycena indigotica]